MYSLAKGGKEKAAFFLAFDLVAFPNNSSRRYLFSQKTWPPQNAQPTSKPTKHKYLMTQKIVRRSCLSGTLKHATLPSHLRVKRKEERQFVPESNKV